jgi:hypothetical protein
MIISVNKFIEFIEFVSVGFDAVSVSEALKIGSQLVGRSGL